MASERFEEAAREFQTAIDLDPLMTLAYYRMGQAHMTLQDYPKAEKAFLGCREAYEKIAGLQFTNTRGGGAPPRAGDRAAPEPAQPHQHRAAQGSRTRRSTTADAAAHRRAAAEPAQGRQRGHDHPRRAVRLPRLGLLPPGQDRGRRRRNGRRRPANPKLGEAHNNLAALYLETNELDERRRS